MRSLCSVTAAQTNRISPESSCEGYDQRPEWNMSELFPRGLCSSSYDVRVAVILVTGMSGVGKSSALGMLKQRGYRVVDTDYGDWESDVPLADGAGTERRWREDLIDALIAEHEASGDPLFISGTVRNQSKFYPRFSEIVLLSAPLHVMLDRIATRDTNPFGKTNDERDKIVADTLAVEPLLRATATVEIDTRKPLAHVVDELSALTASDTHSDVDERQP